MNRHLNIFDFFNDQGFEFYEDNLSRAFALCLKFDTVFLDNVLKQILQAEMYANLFNTDYPDYSIEIDLQNRPSEFENFSKIIAVACSGSEISTDNMGSIVPRETDRPETDLSIKINDTCIIFEFKKTSEDCSAQLKCQAEKIRANSPEGTSILYVDFNWKKIVKSLLNVLSLQKQIGTVNQFTSDLAKFIDKKHPEWFPSRRLSNISFPQDESDPNNYYLDARLNQIKTQIAAQMGLETKEMTGRYSRLVISVSWGWAREVHIESYSDKKTDEHYITIQVYPGDTKAQGKNLFKPGKGAIVWPIELMGYELEADPYLKFSHFNSGLFWYQPDTDRYKITHNSDFLKNAGRWWRKDWEAFEKLMDSIDAAWKDKSEYTQQLINYNRNYFDLSMGIHVLVYMPYKKAQSLDGNDLNSNLATELKSIIENLKNLVDNY